MTPEEMDQVRPRLVSFAAEMLGGLARSDQRATGELCLRGLLLDGKRKSMRPMAARLGVDHQRLQQFVSSSTWDHVEVRRRLARWVEGFVRPDAYVVDDSGFPKDGVGSPGVARMYSGTLGKVGNCQIGVSVHAVADRASAAINWRLFLPQSWDDGAIPDPAIAAEVRRRRARCKIPDQVRHREKWRLALDMLDQTLGAEHAGGWGLAARPVVADSGYGDATEFRLGLTERGLPYVVAVKPTTSAYPADAVPTTPPYRGRGRPPVPRYRDEPTNLVGLALPAGRRALRRVTWRHGSAKNAGNPTAAMRSRFMALRVRPANRDIPETPTAACPNAGCSSNGHPASPNPPTTGCPPSRPTPHCGSWFAWPRSAGASNTTTANWKDGLGLDHFEGRSYIGWHRHVTLTSLAQPGCTAPVPRRR